MYKRKNLKQCCILKFIRIIQNPATRMLSHKVTARKTADGAYSMGPPSRTTYRMSILKTVALFRRGKLILKHLWGLQISLILDSLAGILTTFILNKICIDYKSRPNNVGSSQSDSLGHIQKMRAWGLAQWQSTSLTCTRAPRFNPQHLAKRKRKRMEKEGTEMSDYLFSLGYQHKTL